MLALARDRSAGAHPYLVTVEHTTLARDMLGPERILAPSRPSCWRRTRSGPGRSAGSTWPPYLQLPNYTNKLAPVGLHRRRPGWRRQRPPRRWSRGLGYHGGDLEPHREARSGRRQPCGCPGCHRQRRPADGWVANAGRCAAPGVRSALSHNGTRDISAAPPKRRHQQKYVSGKTA